MGGTFMSMPEDYRNSFIAQLHNALSGFTGLDVDEAVRLVPHVAYRDGDGHRTSSQLFGIEQVQGDRHYDRDTAGLLLAAAPQVMLYVTIHR